MLLSFENDGIEVSVHGAHCACSVHTGFVRMSRAQWVHPPLLIKTLPRVSASKRSTTLKDSRTSQNETQETAKP